MVTHGAVSEHPVVLSFSDLSVWCYLCEAYVHNQVAVRKAGTRRLHFDPGGVAPKRVSCSLQVLFDAKNAAHCAKFGEAIPPWR